MLSGRLLATSNTTRISRKQMCVASEEIILTSGSIWAGKIVFLIRLPFPVTLPVEPDNISEKTNQLVIPAVSHTTKGTSFFGTALKPTLKTTQKTHIMTIGGMKVQTTPSVDPTYRVLTSRSAKA